MADQAQQQNVANGLTALGRMFSSKIPNGYLQFPSDLTSRDDISQYTYMAAYDNYTDYNAVADYREPLGQIYLPLPKELMSNYSSSWSEEDFQEAGAFNEGMGTFFENLKGQITTGGDSSVQRFIKAKTKTIANPFKYVQWRGPQLRHFDFTFECVPHSGAEADTLNQIIWTLKKYIHSPSGQFSPNLEQPPIWNIKFADRDNMEAKETGGSSWPANKYLFELKNFAITNLRVDYTKFGSVFHSADSTGAGLHAPNGVELTISMMETEILTQADFSETYPNKATP